MTIMGKIEIYRNRALSLYSQLMRLSWPHALLLFLRAYLYYVLALVGLVMLCMGTARPFM